MRYVLSYQEIGDACLQALVTKLGARPEGVALTHFVVANGPGGAAELSVEFEFVPEEKDGK